MINRNTSHSHFIPLLWGFNSRQNQQCTRGMLCAKTMCGFRPSVLVARRQLCYERIHFVRLITNDIVSECDDDSDLPYLENFFEEELDSSDVADNSDSLQSL